MVTTVNYALAVVVFIQFFFAEAKLGERNKALQPEKAAPLINQWLNKKTKSDDVSTYIGDGDDTNHRIVGGNDVAGPEVFPFFTSWGGYCGGSLIHSDIVLTAAHCSPMLQLSETVTVGAYELNNPNTELAETRSIESATVHPEYEYLTFANDVLLLKLDSPVTTVQPIQLNKNAFVPQEDQNLTVIGLGDTVEGGSQAAILQEVTVQAIDYTTCNENYGGLVDEDIMLCAGVNEGGKDSCQGDSGGPLFTMTESGAVDRQVGVVSWGFGCAQPGLPGVYAEVSALHDWIFGQICALSNDRPEDCPEPTPAPTPVPPAEGEVAVVVDIFTDNYPTETSWSIVDHNDYVVAEVLAGTYYLSGQVFSHTVNLEIGMEYTFDIRDTFGDGICCSAGNGNYSVETDDIILASGGQFQSSEATTFVVPNVTDSIPLVPGDGEIEITVNVLTDEWPWEIEWSLHELNGTEVASSPLGSYTTPSELYSSIVIVESGVEYNFTIADKAGDGLCCAYGAGNYSVVAGMVTLASGAIYGDFETTIFVAPDVFDIGGCFDTNDEFHVDAIVGYRNCSWLGYNLDRFDYLCQFVDVALACPLTCDFCDIFSYY